MLLVIFLNSKVGVRIMKSWTKALVVAAALALPTLASAQVIGGGLLGTLHDFASGTGDGAGYLTTQSAAIGGATPNSVGLCTFCHTPHQAATTQLLWNHTLSNNSFSWDAATTTGGTNYAKLGPTYTGPTVKCLSCHDGSVAVGDVSLYKAAKQVLNTFKITDPMFQIAAGSALKGNHPVGMPYPFGQAANTYNGITTGTNVTLTEFQSNPVNTNGQAIKLYNDTGTTTAAIAGGAVAAKSGIECSSCHDPHNKAATEDLFLRGKLAGSAAADGYICLQCHIK
jgi:hypothetical protein